ncbi:MAG TPA: metal ABC transporter substrate-binding protein [Actinomycetota bacterium]|nr:metal ABC transporter substrate-binding protein [Actinomycetota bacterium]
MSWRRTTAASIAWMLLAACGAGGAEVSDRPRVVAAFYPLEFAAQRIGGQAVDVTGLTPAGVEPHDLELASDQIRAIAAADLVVYLGDGFQPALEDALSDVDDARRLDALDAVDGSTRDPHVWLDPTLLAQITNEIAARLSEVDPDHVDLFEANAQDLSGDLMDLDRELSTGLRDCEARDLVTSHEAFGHLAMRYQLHQVGISGIDPEAEPSPQRLAEVARFVEANDVRTIFFEELAPPDLAETLARETGAEIAILSPLETAPGTGDYIDTMRLNLERLRRALRCE